MTLRVLVVGGGVAGFEAALALRELAEERVAVALVTPEREFVYRPLTLAEPFGPVAAYRFAIDRLAAPAGAVVRTGSVAGVDAAAREVFLDDGGRMAYDALVVACGGTPVTAVPGALTLTGPEGLTAFGELLHELRAGRVESVAFALPGGAGWTLPLYELALMTARALRAAGVRASLSLVTPEAEPLGLFGRRVSKAVGELLAEGGVEVVTGTYPLAVEADTLLTTGSKRIPAARVVALPRLEGPRLEGLPHDAEGFVPVDPHGSVRGVGGVHAAGDATTFPVKQGGLAAQQADAVAEVIAARAGAPVSPHPFRPVLRGLLLTGGSPRYLRTDLTSGQGETSVAGVDALWWPPGKIAGRYLAPLLAELAGEPLESPPEGGIEVEIDLEPG